jgi:hydrogenase-4 membrane subunit HyfE
MGIIIQIIIALLVAGFIFWAVRQIVALIPMEPIFKQVIDVLLIVAIVAIVLFYVVIPLLHMVAGISINVGGFH